MLSLWVPELPFQLACGRDKRLLDRPLAFLSPDEGGDSPTPTLWLINRLARLEGIAAGESMDRALRLCPGLEVLDPAPQVWWEAQVGFGEFLSRWTPQGTLGRMGEASLELRGTQGLYGTAQDAANRILKELSGSMGWSGHGGISESATAARLAARSEHGIESVRNGFEAGYLAPHPLKRLPSIEAGHLFRLKQLGLELIKDIQPVPLNLLSQFINGTKAKTLLQCARGEDRPRLPMLTDRPNESRHGWRMEPPTLPEAVQLASWLLDKLWKDNRSPRSIKVTWWDVDGFTHGWTAGDTDLCETPLSIARIAERAFRQLSTRRILVHRIEGVIAWGLGRPRSLFDNCNVKLEAIEPALAKLRKRFPEHPVLPGWVNWAKAANT